MIKKKKIIVYGVTGSIGTQTLQVLNEENSYELVAISVHHQIDKIPSIIESFPTIKAVAISSSCAIKKLEKKYPKIKFLVGRNSLTDLLKKISCDVVLNALVGFAGLPVTLEAIKKNLTIALANKESLVIGGELVKKALKVSKAKIIPVDSEHATLHKCIKIAKRKNVEKLYLTASGGAFRDLPREKLKNITPEKALNHPTWLMGKKITIDCATMLNKGYEVVEAYYLFGVDMKDIEIIMHRESHIHSIVKTKDKKFIAEINVPTMINPIRYALTNSYNKNDIKISDDIKKFGDYHFSSFNKNRYPIVSSVLKAFKMEGTMLCVLNAVDEVAVQLFLEKRIKFLDIEKYVALALEKIKNIENPDLETLVKVDAIARRWMRNQIKVKECC